MILTTTPTIEGHRVTTYLGIVSGEAIIGAHIFKDIFASIRDVVGGRAAAYEQTLTEAKDIAMAEMQQRAEQLGADAILSIDLDYEVLGKNNGMLMVSASGTAVKLDK
jgi:uncharacterized protein YbjQ (UPF0145 family)